MAFVNRDTLTTFLTRLETAFARPGRLYLVGETTLLYEGWRSLIERIEICADVADADRAAFDEAVRATAEALGIDALNESPGDLIPLPDGFEDRHRPLGGPAAPLRRYHFDPYSVAFRFIARGDEPDYHLVLTYIDRGWIMVEEMNARLEALLPRFSMQTIAQDPAEFKRKYKGLMQMWRAVRPGTTHRPTPA